MYKQCVMTLLISAALLAGEPAAPAVETGLRIYLPREVTVDGSTPTLGQTAILRGHPSLTDQAAAVTLGHLSVPQQTLVISRSVVLSRLACSGIDTSDVTLTGAEAMRVRRDHQVIAGEDFLAAAKAHLAEHLPDPAICQVQPVRLPSDLVTPGAGDQPLQLVSRVTSLRGNQCTVRTAAVRDGQEVAARETVFLCQYQCRKAFAKTAIAAGQTLTADNVVIRPDVAAWPEPADWTAPYGQVARRAFAAGAEIEPHLVREAAPTIILKRNQTVAIRIHRPGFVASAMGTALQDGAVGEYIKVKNVDSQKVIMARITEDGSVEPVF